MTYRLTKIYTRKGDDGFTHLGDNRIPKDDLLVEVVGTIDELNAAIGVLLTQEIKNADTKIELHAIQNRLFDFGGELHLPRHQAIHPNHVTELEQQIDTWNETLPPLTEFILPGGTPASAFCHLARTICRRAERTLVHLHQQTPLQNIELLRYLNRLSDYLFVCARILARETDAQEKLWDHER